MIALISDTQVSFSTLNFMLMVVIFLPTGMVGVVLLFLVRRNTLTTAESVVRLESTLTRLVDAQIQLLRASGMRKQADILTNEVKT